MKIRPINISFEFFPPKTSEGKETLSASALALTKAHPSFFSVTFGAGGANREGTVATIQQLQTLTSVSIAPHITCMGLEGFEIQQILMQYKKIGSKRLV